MNHFDPWNREELYAEVWEAPLTKVAQRYGISDVALGKVCRKLKIPVPGRGYWAKKAAGILVVQTPLPPASNLPVVFKPVQPLATVRTPASPAAQPTDPEYLQILEVEGRPLGIDPEAKQHKLVRSSARCLKTAAVDARGMLQPPWSTPCLDVRVSRSSLERALRIMNAIIVGLDGAGFSVIVEAGHQGTRAKIFGHWVSFALAEKAKVKDRREEKHPGWTTTVTDFEPTGQLEFRAGDSGYTVSAQYRDSQRRRLEDQIPECVGAVLREGRSMLLWAQRRAAEDAERRIKEQEMAHLAKQIKEEEQKIADLDAWVSSWVRAHQMREFIAALETKWLAEGHDLSVGSQKAERIAWMKQQADRRDPMLPSPPSIIDRKQELRGY